MASKSIKVSPCIFNNCKFDSKRDIRPVEDIIPMKVSSMLESGFVPPEGTTIEYAADYSDPSCIRGRCVDTFDAIRKVNGIVSDAHFAQVQANLADSAVSSEPAE